MTSQSQGNQTCSQLVQIPYTGLCTLTELYSGGPKLCPGCGAPAWPCRSISLAFTFGWCPADGVMVFKVPALAAVSCNSETGSEFGLQVFDQQQFKMSGDGCNCTIMPMTSNIFKETAEPPLQNVLSFSGRVSCSTWTCHELREFCLASVPWEGRNLFQTSKNTLLSAGKAIHLHPKPISSG